MSGNTTLADRPALRLLCRTNAYLDAHGGKGYGTETARLVLEYGFTALNLHNIMLTTQSFNERAIRAYTRAGFREFGRRRAAHWLAGHAYDVVYMDCLASEFEGVALRSLLP